MDVGSLDSAGTRNIVLRNHSGRQAEFSAMSDGTLMQVSDNGVPMRRQITPEDLERSKRACTSSENQGVVSDGICETICGPVCTTLWFMVSIPVFVMACSMVCAPTAELCFPVCFVVAEVLWVWISASNCNNICTWVCN